jgi:hypothetical protein
MRTWLSRIRALFRGRQCDEDLDADVRPRAVSFLYEVQARDPAVFIVMPLVLTIVSFLAVWLPARRASTVNPLIALRAQ